MNDAHPDLGGLLRGDLGNAEALEIADHARSCATCREDLVDLALGHGLLTAAARRAGPVASATLTRADTSHSAELPAVLRRELRRGRRRRPVLVAVVAAALAVAAVSAALLLPGDDENAGPPAATLQIATLEPVPGTEGAPGGEVSMATDRALVTRMRVNTVDLPQAPRGDFYYVWLLDPATNKMLPLGQVIPGHRASFDLPESLVAAYTAIDISLESDDGDPGHSVTSVLRASYAAPSAPS